MEVKDAIELVNSGTYIVAWESKAIIALLKEGEENSKYKKMWFELCDVFNHSSGKELMHMNSEDFRNHINKIRDKYLEG